MSDPIDLVNTQCPFCKQPTLAAQIVHPDREKIYPNAILCESCGKFYDLIWNVPYLGIFKQDNIISLLEITANAAQYPIKEGKTRNHDYLKVINMLEEYTTASNKDAVVSKYGLTSVPQWLKYRYGDHLLFKTLTQSIDLCDKQVLDIGAGSGFDSLKFYNQGAKVTCLEFNPALAGFGRIGYSQMRWFGGSSDNLPFSDCQFDIVTANAALHHFSDIPKALQESLRVLKVGGYLVTLGDPFMADGSTEEQEALIFNDHTDVLQGVNEQVPEFNLFIETFKLYEDSLDIRIFTQDLHGAVPHYHEWSFEESISKFPSLAGSINFLVRKKRPIAVFQNNREAIRPCEFAKGLENIGSGVDNLVDLVPEQFLNLPITDQSQPKFRLLNGWRLQNAGASRRSAYKRARLFFSLDRLRKFLRFSLLIPYISDYDSPKISIKLNSTDIFSEEMVRGVWHDRSVPISAEIHTCKNFVVEIRLQSSVSSDEAQEFYVEKLDFSEENHVSNSSKLTGIRIEHFGLETLALTVLRDKNPIPILMSPVFEHNMNVINRLRKQRLKAHLIVPRGQQFFYSWLPECEVIEVYPDDVFDSDSVGQGYQTQNSVQLIAAPDAKSVAILQKMALAASEELYWIQLAGHGQLIHSRVERFTSDSNSNSASAPVDQPSTNNSEQSPSSSSSKGDKLKRLRDQSQQLRERVRHLEKELSDSKGEISAMKTSKFWKIRDRWFKFKKAVGLDVENQK